MIDFFLAEITTGGIIGHELRPTERLDFNGMEITASIPGNTFSPLCLKKWQKLRLGMESMNRSRAQCLTSRKEEKRTVCPSGKGDSDLLVL